MKKVNKNSSRFLTAALITMSLLLAAVTCAKVVIFANEASNLSANIKKAVNSGVIDNEKIREFQGVFSAAAAKLKKKSVFAPPPPGKVNPVKKVDAILGSSAMINDKWYNVGDSIGEAKLISVNFAEITVLWNGKEVKFSPISAPTKYAVRKNPEPVKVKDAVEAKPAQAVQSEQPEAQPAAETVQEDPLAWAGVTMSPALRAKILEKWNKMSDEEKEKAKKEWGRMSSTQKQAMVDRMETMIDRL